MQPVGTLAAENLDGEIPCQEVRVLAGNRQLAHADLGLHRIRLVDDDDPARRLRRLGEATCGHIRLRPRAEYFLGGRKRLAAGHVPDDRQDHVVRNEIATMKGLQILACHRAQRVRCSAARQSVGMEPVDQSIEHRRRHVIRILAVHAQRRDRLLLLPLDLLQRERRVAHDVGQQRHSEAERVLHHDDVRE
jgi:hypothetical protein